MDQVDRKRISLKQVQPSASHPNVLVGNNRPIKTEVIQKKRSLSLSSTSYKRQKVGSHSSGSFKIFEDQPDEETPKPAKRKRLTAHDLTSEEPTLNYWMVLAESRREALEDALQENKKLHTRVSELENQVTEMKSDLEKAEELADHAEYLAAVVTKLTEDVDGENTDTETEISDSQCAVSGAVETNSQSVPETTEESNSQCDNRFEGKNKSESSNDNIDTREDKS